MKSNNVGHNLGQTVWGIMDKIYLKHKCKAGFFRDLLSFIWMQIQEDLEVHHRFQNIYLHKGFP